MGRMDVSKLRYLEGEHFRVMLAVEMGMKNHELVPLQLISSIARIHRGGVTKTLGDIGKFGLVAYERGTKYDGYRLTKLGYDYLALKALCSREVVGSVGNQIGVGKESDVYVGGDPELNDLCLKFHRLGRTSFRKIKEKRDYHKKRKSASWLYLSRLAAAKEFAFLKALADAKFPVPRPVDVCRHLVVMGLVEGLTLCHVDEIDDPGALYDRLMCLIARLARYGLIHGDFNEFNVMLVADEKVVLIDFPQMVSMDHPNAKYYFERDVECVRTLFKRKFNYDCDEFPKFEEMTRKYNLDVELEASGFTRKMEEDLNRAYDEGNFRAHEETIDEGAGESESNDDEEDDEPEWEDELSDVEEGDEEDSQGDYDKEEQAVERKENEKKADDISKSGRFSSWLATATSQVDQQVEEATGEHSLLEHPRNMEIAEEVRKDREAYIKARQEADEEETDALEREMGTDAVDDRNKQALQKKRTGGTRSVRSTGSTIAPEEIKRRVALESKRQKEKIRLKVKGRQSAVNRGRKENTNKINEDAFWD
ncbi:unnamed protein product, partial [Mesorhabditis spiculigera]